MIGHIVEERTIHQCGRQRLESASSLEMRPQIPLSQAHNFVWFFLLRSAEPEFIYCSCTLVLCFALWRSIRRRREITHKRKTSETTADDRNNPTSSLSLSLFRKHAITNHQNQNIDIQKVETTQCQETKNASLKACYTQMQNNSNKKMYKPH